MARAAVGLAHSDASPELEPRERAPLLPTPRRAGWRRLLVVALLAGAAGLWYWRGNATEEPPMPLLAGVERGDVEISVLATGLLKPSKLVAVGAEASGRIIALPVRVGQTVAAGDLIAEIDSSRQRNALRTSEAAHAASVAQRVEKEATLRVARATLERQRALAASGRIAESALETAEADVAVNEAQLTAINADIAAAEVAVTNAEVELGYTRITAPMAGTVLAVVAQEGQTVNAVQSTPTMVVLGDLETMSIRAAISEADVVRVTPGQDVWFTILGDTTTRHRAVLDEIAPAPESITDDPSLTGSGSVETQAIYYDGLFTVPNPDGRLRTYMTAEVHVVLDRAEGVLTVPSAAVRRGADRTTTVEIVHADRRRETRSVEVGLDDRSVTEVRSGLAEGEQVVAGEPASDAATGRRRMGMGF